MESCVGVINSIMWNRISGYILTGLGMLGFFFFVNYKGTSIPLKELWFVVSVFVVGTGIYFLIKYKIEKKAGQNNQDAEFDRIRKLKIVGDKIKVTLANAEVKNRTYNQEIINDTLPTQTEIIDALFDSNRGYKTEEIRQTYIVYHKKYGQQICKFVSPATTYDAEALKNFIEENNGIDLYIDPKNPLNYYFDFYSRAI